MLTLIIAIAIGVCLVIVAWRMLRLLVVCALVLVLVVVAVEAFHHLDLGQNRAPVRFGDVRHSVAHRVSWIEHAVTRAVGTVNARPREH